MPVAATTELPDAQQPTLGNGVEDEISVSWTDVIDNGQYDLDVREVDDADNATPSWSRWASLDEATTSDIITGREDGEAYEVRMRTRTDHKTGAWTSAVSIVTKFPGATGVTVDTKTATSVDLSWTDNADNEDGFKVERREQFRGGWGAWLEIADVSPDTTTHTDPNALPNTTYEYRIQAYTEETSATSSATQTTTDDDGVPTDRIPATGWHVVVEDGAGALYEPAIIGEPRLNPTLNDLPTCEIPVERSGRWEDADKWERAPMRVYHDGERQPIEEVQEVRLEPGQAVLVGVGGVELRQRVSTDVIEQDAHTTADTLITSNTGLTANVDDPASTVSAGVLQQSVDMQSEWSTALDTSPSASDVYEVQNGELRPRQTAHFVEAEDADVQRISNVAYFTGSEVASAQGAVRITDWEMNGTEAEITHTFSLDHTIPAGDGGFRFRYRCDDGNHGAFRVLVDGEEVLNAAADAFLADTSFEWDGLSMEATHDLSGEVTCTIEFTGPSASNDPLIYIDCMSLFDERHPPGFTENVDGLVLEGPDLYPSGINVETADVTTVEQVVGGKLTSTWNKTNGSQAVALSNDSGATWPISASNSTSVEGSFGSGSTSLRARLTLGGYDDDPTTSPAGRKAPHTVDLYDLYADLEDTPLLADRSWDNSLRAILNDIADYGDFVWEVQWDSSIPGLTVEWTQPGQRTATVDPALVDYATDTDFASIHRKAIIYGTSVPDETTGVTADHDNWVALDDDWLLETGEVVQDAGGGTVYSRGSDYELKPNAGEIKVLSTGAIADGASLDVSYDRRIRGTYASADYDGTYEEFVDSVPAITTQRNADQAALSLVRQAADPLVTASVTIHKQPTGMSLVEAVDVDKLPVDESMEVWSLEDSPQSVTLQLGSRERLAETITRIESRLASAARKV